MPGLSTTIWLMPILSIGAAADNQGWFAVQRDVQIDHDMETTPIEIKTNSTTGSGDKVALYFYTSQGDYAAGVNIRFTTPPQLFLHWCDTYYSNLPTATDKVWRITKTRTPGIRVQIHCNEEEVLDLVISDSTCYFNVWKRYVWTKQVAKISFSSDDTASHFYRPMRGNCTGLKADWNSTIATPAQFPVAPGTVVEVTCSESGALNKGSSAVTCVTETEFSFTEEPSCSKPVSITLRDRSLESPEIISVDITSQEQRLQYQLG